MSKIQFSSNKPSSGEGLGKIEMVKNSQFDFCFSKSAINDCKVFQRILFLFMALSTKRLTCGLCPQVFVVLSLSRIIEKAIIEEL